MKRLITLFMETELLKKKASDILELELFPDSGSKGLFPINIEE